MVFALVLLIEHLSINGSIILILNEIVLLDLFILDNRLRLALIDLSKHLVSVLGVIDAAATWHAW